MRQKGEGLGLVGKWVQDVAWADHLNYIFLCIPISLVARCNCNTNSKKKRTQLVYSRKQKSWGGG